jgi:hypothetical protein
MSEKRRTHYSISRAAEELGVEPKKLVKMWFEAALPELEELEARAKDVKPERKEVEKHEALIKEGWLTLVNG